MKLHTKKVSNSEARISRLQLSDLRTSKTLKYASYWDKMGTAVAVFCGGLILLTSLARVVGVPTPSEREIAGFALRIFAVSMGFTFGFIFNKSKFDKPFSPNIIHFPRQTKRVGGTN